jgi:hypothetical protein
MLGSRPLSVSVPMLAELERQASILLAPRIARLFGGVDRLAPALASLRPLVERAAPVTTNIPLCVVIRSPSFPAAALMDNIHARGASGIVDMTPAQPDEFKPIASVELPATDVYVLLGVDTGRARLDITPEASLAAIHAEGRTPLTLEEGVMLALMFPAMLTDKQTYNCIQMPGSRRESDQRVPSIWISKGRPRLGWCWDRNPHTWLASASAARRVGPVTR